MPAHRVMRLNSRTPGRAAALPAPENRRGGPLVHLLRLRGWWTRPYRASAASPRADDARFSILATRFRTALPRRPADPRRLQRQDAVDGGPVVQRTRRAGSGEHGDCQLVIGNWSLVIC